MYVLRKICVHQEIHTRKFKSINKCLPAGDQINPFCYISLKNNDEQMMSDIRVYIVWFILYEVQIQVNWIYGDRSQNSGYQLVGGRSVSWLAGARKNLLVAVNCPQLDRTEIPICIKTYSSSCIILFGYLICYNQMYIVWVSFIFKKVNNTL